MKISTLVIIASILFQLNTMALDDRNNFIPHGWVKIEGTAQGGAVTLTFQPGVNSNLESVSVITTAGQSASDVAQKLIEKVAVTSGSIAKGSVKGSIIRIPNFSTGQIALESTDAGITAIAAPSNVTLLKTLEDKIQIDWTIPNNTQYERILIFRVGGSIVASLSGNTTTYTDSLFEIIAAKEFATPSEKLKYWIIGLKNGIPSKAVIIEIANPVN